MALDLESMQLQLTTRAHKSFDNIDNSFSSATINKIVDGILKNTFTIIYPFGTKDKPGIATKNTVYAIANPFPGYAVKCLPEVYYDGQWGVSEWAGYYTAGASSPEYVASGLICLQHNENKLMLKVGTNYVAVNNNTNDKNCYHISFTTKIPAQTTLPFRIKVWKVGRWSKIGKLK